MSDNLKQLLGSLDLKQKRKISREYDREWSKQWREKHEELCRKRKWLFLLLKGDETYDTMRYVAKMQTGKPSSGRSWLSEDLKGNSKLKYFEIEPGVPSLSEWKIWHVYYQ